MLELADIVRLHGDQTRDWLAARDGLSLPCSFFLVTFTLPAELRDLAFANQRKVYGMLMRCAAQALQKLAHDPRWLGTRLGCLAVLHTWTRALLYHPHVHLLVTCGGLPPDGSRWLRPKNPAFLVPVRALSLVFRAKRSTALPTAIAPWPSSPPNRPRTRLKIQIRVALPDSVQPRILVAAARDKNP